MEDITIWFSNLEGIEKTFWICAIASSLVFLIQSVLTFIGIDSTDTDFDFSFEEGNTMDFGGALSLFSVRNIVNFLLGFGWSGVCLNKYIDNNLLLIAVASIIGVLFVVIFFFLVRMMMKFEKNGTIKMEDCIGKSCDVYLRIPASRNGKGKIQLSINGTVQEFEAITDDENMIATGSRVKIIKHMGSSTFLVAKE